MVNEKPIKGKKYFSEMSDINNLAQKAVHLYLL